MQSNEDNDINMLQHEYTGSTMREFYDALRDGGGRGSFKAPSFSFNPGDVENIKDDEERVKRAIESMGLTVEDVHTDPEKPHIIHITAVDSEDRKFDVEASKTVGDEKS